jgi:hypothetical protein
MYRLAKTISVGNVVVGYGLQEEWTWVLFSV